MRSVHEVLPLVNLDINPPVSWRSSARAADFPVPVLLPTAREILNMAEDSRDPVKARMRKIVTHPGGSFELHPVGLAARSRMRTDPKAPPPRCERSYRAGIQQLVSLGLLHVTFQRSRSPRRFRLAWRTAEESAIVWRAAAAKLPPSCRDSAAIPEKPTEANTPQDNGMAENPAGILLTSYSSRSEKKLSLRAHARRLPIQDPDLHRLAEETLEEVEAEPVWSGVRGLVHGMVAEGVDERVVVHELRRTFNLWSVGSISFPKAHLRAVMTRDHGASHVSEVLVGDVSEPQPNPIPRPTPPPQPAAPVDPVEREADQARRRAVIEAARKLYHPALLVGASA